MEEVLDMIRQQGASPRALHMRDWCTFGNMLAKDIDLNSVKARSAHVDPGQSWNRDRGIRLEKTRPSLVCMATG